MRFGFRAAHDLGALLSHLGGFLQVLRQRLFQLGGQNVKRFFVDDDFAEKATFSTLNYLFQFVY